MLKILPLLVLDETGSRLAIETQKFATLEILEKI